MRFLVLFGTGLERTTGRDGWWWGWWSSSRCVFRGGLPQRHPLAPYFHIRFAVIMASLRGEEVYTSARRVYNRAVRGAGASAARDNASRVVEPGFRDATVRGYYSLVGAENIPTAERRVAMPSSSLRSGRMVAVPAMVLACVASLCAGDDLPFWDPPKLVNGTMRADNVVDIMELACMDPEEAAIMRYAEIPENFGRPTGIFLKGHCPLFEFIIWYEDQKVALWVNSVMAASLLWADVLSKPFSDVVRDEVYTVLDAAFGRETFFAGVARTQGCLNPETPWDYECYGRKNLKRFDAEDRDDAGKLAC
ncbi:envelope glycoprotein L [Falconid herpesvirus 1]|uniref:Envelope glycoprotein L n=2 Tax=Columbid alphaherpesvirus 1 TaxID=93386 RepID=A0A068ERX4_9ALPH|nr:envelope glycoprotein L [Falconid herpesvirus 1]YP_009352904.1 envelope glycoprotein L [Columbid alphaherpesvirus 1]AID52700.1 envelope glycoprotein L [Falconid herpesvirus 1]ARD71321.1 envelope glycoprotein L [Columbid alphaherpesvirus 1]